MRIQLRRAVAAMSAASARSLTSKVTGLARGPYAVGNKTIQLTDDARQDEERQKHQQQIADLNERGGFRSSSYVEPQ